MVVQRKAGQQFTEMSHLSLPLPPVRSLRDQENLDFLHSFAYAFESDPSTPEAALPANQHCAAERDALDDELDAMHGSLADSELDDTAIELASRLCDRGDTASMFDAASTQSYQKIN